MKKILLTLFAFVSLNAMGQVKTWDFTKLPDTDFTNLTTDLASSDTWWQTEEKEVSGVTTTRYSNKSAITKNTDFTLSANSSDLSITEGLSFYRASSNVSAGAVRIDAGVEFQISGSNVTITVPSTYATNGRTAVIKCASAGSSSRTLTFTGASITSLTEATTEGFVTYEGGVVTFAENANAGSCTINLSITTDGFTILQSNGINFYSIEIYDAATALETVEAAEVDENAPIYNLLGQKVQKGTKGILIQNGKKFIQK